MTAQNLSSFFTRASSGWYYNASGVWTQASTNAPRYDYDPVTLAYRGLLMEESRTNIMLRSASFDLFWTKGPNITVTADTVTAPDGTLTADTVSIGTAGSAAQYIRQTQGALGVDTAYCTSGYVKKNTYRYVYVRTAGSGVTVWPTFDLDTGTWVQTGTPAHTVGVQVLPNGWFRIWASRTVTAAESSGGWNTSLGIPSSAGAETWNATGTESVYMWGGQCEVGAFPSSYIPTTTAQVTRSADSISLSTSAAWLNMNTLEGTMYAEIVTAPGTNTNNQILMCLDDGTSLNRLALYKLAASGTMKAFARVANVLQADLVGASVGNMTTMKAAFAYKSNDFSLVVNAGTPVTTSSGTLPTPNTLVLGDASGSGAKLNGWLRDLRYYPYRMTNAAMQTLTT